jgi:hypothetical protein
VTTALISVETVLLVLLVVLVAGLLRSHAEILRRLGPAGEAVPPPPAPERRARSHEPAPDLVGVTPEGDAIKLAFTEGRRTLLAFLTTGCSSCAGFWETLAEPRLGSQVETVIVTHGSERELPAKLSALAPRGVPVVMSSSAWEEYRVPGSPYFVLVDGTVRGEGVATTWQALASLVGDAIEDERAHTSAGARRAREIDVTLAASGIGPDHPSLYPAGAANGEPAP